MRLARHAPLLALLLGGGCTCDLAATSDAGASRPPTPEAPASEAAPRAGEAAPRAGARAVDGGYFQLSVPEGWSARRTPRTMVLEAPADRAAVRVIVSRPVPFEGDAAAFAETLRPAFEEAGFEGDPGHEGRLGELEARVIDGTGAGATARYWFVVVDGYGISFSCTGRVAPAEQVQALCGRIAATFRLEGSLADHALLERGDRLEVAGFHLREPEGWTLSETGAPPGVVAALRGPEGEDGLGATLSVEPFEGDLAALRERARARAREGGYAMELGPGRLLERDAASYVVEQPDALGGRRARVLETVDSGRAVRLSCYGPPAAFERVEAACRAMAASLRR